MAMFTNQLDPMAYDRFASVPKDGRPLLLSVDDDEVNQEVVEMALGSEYRIIRAMDGMEALDYLSQDGEVPHAVLLDIMMPGMTGFEVVATIRKQYAQLQLPVLMLSARAPHELTGQDALNAGATDFMSKPFCAEVLKLKLRLFISLSEEYNSLLAEHRAKKSEKKKDAKTLKPSLSQVQDAFDYSDADRREPSSPKTLAKRNRLKSELNNAQDKLESLTQRIEQQQVMIMNLSEQNSLLNGANADLKQRNKLLAIESAGISENCARLTSNCAALGEEVVQANASVLQAEQVAQAAEAAGAAQAAKAAQAAEAAQAAQAAQAANPAQAAEVAEAAQALQVSQAVVSAAQVQESTVLVRKARACNANCEEDGKTEPRETKKQLRSELKAAQDQISSLTKTLQAKEQARSALSQENAALQEKAPAPSPTQPASAPSQLQQVFAALPPPPRQCTSNDCRCLGEAVLIRMQYDIAFLNGEQQTANDMVLELGKKLIHSQTEASNYKHQMQALTRTVAYLKTTEPVINKLTEIEDSSRSFAAGSVLGG